MEFDDEEYDEYDEYDDYDEEYEEVVPVRASKKNDYYKEEVESRSNRASQKPKITPVRNRTAMELTLVKPTDMADAQQISDCLLEGKTVVLNMESILSSGLAQRILDFTSGATYSLNGKLQRVSDGIFIVTPPSVDLSGDFHNLLSSESLGNSAFGMRM